MIEGCEIFGNTLSAIQVRGAGAKPAIHRNTIRDGKHGGIYIHDGASATITENDITGNAYAGVWISEGANPMVRQNRIFKGQQVGIYVYDKGRGQIEANTIYGHKLAEIQVRSGGDPKVTGNTIADSENAGVFVYDSGLGRFEHNTITNNAKGGVVLKSAAAPIFINNDIRVGAATDSFAMYVAAGTHAVIEANVFDEDEDDTIFREASEGEAAE